jgi:CHASE3 domain sensor protein
MDGSRSDRARARAQQLLAEIAPLPDDPELQRLRELSLNYIREAERAEGNPVSTREESEQISAALDAIARDFFARALQNKSRG